MSPHSNPTQNCGEDQRVLALQLAEPAGIRIGVQEIDFLAVRPGPKGTFERRQVEVQCSYRPVSYISPVPKAVRLATGKGSNNARKRDKGELRQGVKEWVEKKYAHPKKDAVRQKLCPGKWTRELVVTVVRHPIELELFAEHGPEETGAVVKLRDLFGARTIPSQ